MASMCMYTSYSNYRASKTITVNYSRKCRRKGYRSNSKAWNVLHEKRCIQRSLPNH